MGLEWIAAQDCLNANYVSAEELKEAKLNEKLKVYCRNFLTEQLKEQGKDTININFKWNHYVITKYQ